MAEKIVTIEYNAVAIQNTKQQPEIISCSGQNHF
jgi:hypothetical protein